MSILARILIALFGTTATIATVATGFFYPLVDWVKSFVLNHIVSFVWMLVPDGLADYLASADIESVAGLIQDVAWFIPFWAIVSIYFVSISMASAVLLVRYIIGWIPTVEG